MAYDVEVLPSVVKALTKLPRNDVQAIYRRLETLREDPRPRGAEKIQGERDAWRVRQGNYRIVYRVDDIVLVVTVVRIGHRRDVYRKR